MSDRPEIDSRFKVTLVDGYLFPQKSIWMALHQDYSEEFVSDEIDYGSLDETECGHKVVKLLLKGDKGHYGCLEHPQATFNFGWFPHSVMQQMRTHRTGITFDVQSGRYTGKRILDAAEGKRDIEDVFYLRQPNKRYTDRKGVKYFYAEEEYRRDRKWLMIVAKNYARKIIKCGWSEEHARGLSAFDVRQHYVMSANSRTVMHLLDVRHKRDAQEEIQWACELLMQRFEEWSPEIAAWYKEARLNKARLAP